MAKEKRISAEAPECLLGEQPEGATPATRIMQLFRQHDAIHRAMNHRPINYTDEEGYALHMQMMEVEAEMKDTPCSTLADHAAKTVALFGREDGANDWKDGAFWQEARGLIGAELGVPPEALL